MRVESGSTFVSESWDTATKGSQTLGNPALHTQETHLVGAESELGILSKSPAQVDVLSGTASLLAPRARLRVSRQGGSSFAQVEKSPSYRVTSPFTRERSCFAPVRSPSQKRPSGAVREWKDPRGYWSALTRCAVRRSGLRATPAAPGSGSRASRRQAAPRSPTRTPTGPLASR